MAENRMFTAEFRISIAERILKGESASVLSAELQIRRSILNRWRDRYRREGAEGLSRGAGRPPGARGTPKVEQTSGKTSAETLGRVAELERRLGQLALENDFLRRAFKRAKAARSTNSAPGEAPCTEK